MPKITVYVNDKPKVTFLGMRVRNVIGARAVQRVQTHRAIVRDGEGNVVDIDGALYDGERLYIAPMDPQTFAEEIQRRAG
ncbi:MAG: hypothetical protein N2559_03160 [Anaerolineae bacterium]|nr:hypothetical protein [Anaerolineae bacterium]